MRKTLVVLVSLVALACASSQSPTAPSTTAVPTKASLVIDMTKPDAPVLDSIKVLDIQGQRVTAQVYWTDKSTAADEWNTCFRFTGSGLTTQCAYAGPASNGPQYYNPAGTGPKTAVIVIPRGEYDVVAYTTRQGPDTNGVPVRSVDSNSIHVCAKQNC